jgi:NAD(P)-dependent dehydrogenase (short-subunit alcohol dehydrogenase family)
VVIATTTYTYTVSEKRDIKGSVIVITGASSGMGLATAKALLAKGARVVLGRPHSIKCW